MDNQNQQPQQPFQIDPNVQSQAVQPNVSTAPQPAAAPVEVPYNPPPDVPPQVLAPFGGISASQGYAPPQAPQTAFTQAAQAAGVVNAPTMPPSFVPLGTQDAAQEAAFADEVNLWADKITIGTTTYFYNALDDAMKKEVRNSPRVLAQQLGFPYEAFKAGTNGDGTPLVLTEEQEAFIENYGDALQMRVIANALRSWSASRRCDPENIAKLLPHVRRELSEAIINLSLSGEREARFRAGVSPLRARG